MFKNSLIVLALITQFSAAQAAFNEVPVNPTVRAPVITCGNGSAVLTYRGNQLLLTLDKLTVFGSQISGTSEAGDCEGFLRGPRISARCMVNGLDVRFSSGGFAGLQMLVNKRGENYPASFTCN